MPNESSVLTRKVFDQTEAQFAPGERSMVAWITTDCVDHEKDVVVSSGVDYKSHFLGKSPEEGNPCVLAFHDYGRWPLGQCKWIKSKKNNGFSGLVAKTIFDDDPETELVFGKIKSGSLRGISIGFRPPDDFKPSEWGPPTKEELLRRPDWAGAKRVIRRCVLLEYSVCSLPMNPQALVAAVNKGIRPPSYPTPVAEAQSMPVAAETAALPGGDSQTADETTITKGQLGDDLEVSMCVSAIRDLSDRFFWHLLNRLYLNEDDFPLVDRLESLDSAFDEYKETALRVISLLMGVEEAEDAEEEVKSVTSDYLDGLAGPDSLPKTVHALALKCLGKCDEKDCEKSSGDDSQFKPGAHVKFKGGCGVVQSVHKDGSHLVDSDDESEGDVEASEDAPVAKIACHSKGGDGKCMATKRVRSMPCSQASPVDSKAKAIVAPPEPYDDETPASTTDRNPDPLPQTVFRRGDAVAIDGDGHKGYGKVHSIHVGGDFVPDVDQHVIGTADEPAARVHRYQAKNGGFVKTGHHTAHKCKHLTKLDGGLAEPQAKSIPAAGAKVKADPEPELISGGVTDEERFAKAVSDIKVALSPTGIAETGREQARRLFGAI